MRILIGADVVPTQIQQSGKVEELYGLFSKEMLGEYLLKISGKKSFVYRVINKLTGNKLSKFVMGSKYTSKILLVVLNCLDCEAHRELFAMGILAKIRA